MAVDFLVVGLGNPGEQYARTRHNAGFWVIDALAERHGFGELKEKHGALWSMGRIGSKQVVLAKPMTYMNRSGEPTQALAHFFKVPPTQVLVVHDELDFAPGEIRLKVGGGAGGHNGLRSLIACLGGDFIRLRVGVGKAPVSMEGADYVLGVPTSGERKQLEEACERACVAIAQVLEVGPQKAMNEVHRAK